MTESMNEFHKSTFVFLLSDFSFQNMNEACQPSVWYLYPMVVARFFFYSQKDPGFCKPSGKNVRVLAGWDLYSRPFCFPFLSFPP